MTTISTEGDQTPADRIRAKLWGAERSDTTGAIDILAIKWVAANRGHPDYLDWVVCDEVRFAAGCMAKYATDAEILEAYAQHIMEGGTPIETAD